MEFVAPDHISVSLDASGPPLTVIAHRRDAVVFPRILVNPKYRSPQLRVGHIWRYQMKTLGIGPEGMTKLLYVTRQQKVERFELLRILFPSIEVRQGAENARTADRYAAYSGRVLHRWMRNCSIGC